MAKVLYADYDRDPERLARVLRAEGIEVDCIGNRTEDNKRLTLANEILFREYYDNLQNYRVLIAHLGVGFNSQARHLSDDFPQLQIVLLSTLPSHYSEQRGRIWTFGYDSRTLLAFVEQR